ncbi:hypothetical protein [Falsiroseomonas ponticola]|jgi:hypothetical protein|uniref:hypothetical protein n=1 Tax=Falsiroseomonas ponticola TaxID=2786951 RepID=UPI0019337EFC|nr:hypothetical protein [Roseomonas ponticola]
MRHAPFPILVALSLGLAGCAPQEGEEVATGASPAGGRPTLAAVADRLPDAVAGFTRRDTTWHEQSRAGLGVAMDYDGPARSAVATVSVYDRGLAGVPDNTDSAALQAEFTAAVSEAVAMAGTRTSQRIAERDRTDVEVPGQAPMRCATLHGTYGRQEVQTLVCLGPAAGRFLKILVTSPARQVRPVNPVPFVVGVAQAARG